MRFASPTWDIVSSNTGKKAFVGSVIDAKEDEFRLAGDMMDSLFQTQQLAKQAEAYREAAKNGGGRSSGSSSGGGDGTSGIGKAIGSFAGGAIASSIPGGQLLAPFAAGLGGGLGDFVEGLF